MFSCARTACVSCVTCACVFLYICLRNFLAFVAFLAHFLFCLRTFPYAKPCVRCVRLNGNRAESTQSREAYQPGTYEGAPHGGNCAHLPVGRVRYKCGALSHPYFLSLSLPAVYQFPYVSVPAKYYFINFNSFCCISNKIFLIRRTATVPKSDL